MTATTRLVLPFLVLALASCAKEPRDIESLVRRDRILLDPRNGEPYSGPVYRVDGHLEYVEIKRGIPSGLYREYERESGGDLLREEGAFLNGEQHGPWVTYREEKIYSTGNYVNGKRHGRWYERVFWDLYEMTYANDTLLSKRRIPEDSVGSHFNR